MPGKLDVGDPPHFADAGDRDQLASSGGNAEGGFVGIGRSD
jgi:hypothetical protein